jgi:hypothetical protein
MAAWSRKDASEEQRIVLSASGLRLRLRDFAPHMMAFKNLALVTYAELFDHAMGFVLAWTTTGLGTGTPQRDSQAAGLEQARLLRVKWQAWQRFSGQWNASPTLLWSEMPGFQRLQGILAIVETLAADHPEAAAEPGRSENASPDSVDSVTIPRVWYHSLC